MATADPVYLDFVVVTGEQRSRGVEAELQWQPVRGLSLNLAYTYVDAMVTKDNFFTIGHLCPMSPKHNFGAFAQYQVQDGPLAGLGAPPGRKL